MLTRDPDGVQQKPRPTKGALVAQQMRTRAKGPRALFARAVDRGELDEEADMRMAMSVIAGAISHRILVEGGRLTPVFVKRLVRLVIDGLTAGGKAGGRAGRPCVP